MKRVVNSHLSLQRNLTFSVPKKRYRMQQSSRTTRSKITSSKEMLFPAFSRSPTGNERTNCHYFIINQKIWFLVRSANVGRHGMDVFCTDFYKKLFFFLTLLNRVRLGLLFFQSPESPSSRFFIEILLVELFSYLCQFRRYVTKSISGPRNYSFFIFVKKVP